MMKRRREITVRQSFYQLVAVGAIKKTNAAYRALLRQRAFARALTIAKRGRAK